MDKGASAEPNAPSPELASVVIDASVGISLVRAEPLSEVATEAVASWRTAGTRLIVPTLFWLELANALVRGPRTAAEAVESIYHLEQLDLGTIELDRPTVLLTIELAKLHGLTAYDAHYLALAVAMDARLATGDQSLAAAAGDRAILLLPARRPDRLSESYAAYGTLSIEPTQPAWPGLGGYLAQLRAEFEGRRRSERASERLRGLGSGPLDGRRRDHHLSRAPGRTGSG